jgi:hypothetical protein
MREVSELLGSWNSFYVMIGSSAAALTGLMFVVITLVSNNDGGSEDGLSTFSTPTVVHFSCALFTAAIMSAPFHSLVPISIVTGLVGVAGLFQVVRVGIRTARLERYRPDLEDWTWNVALPSIAYAAMLLGAIAMHRYPARALFAPASAVTLLIFVGIHNAWDVVTFLATGKANRLGDPPQDADPAKPNTTR